jgi:DNA-binding NtrC family response regulator
MNAFAYAPTVPEYALAGRSVLGRSVLLVDDEPGIRTALTAHFVREGWRVTSASGVREAEHRLRQGEFDLLVSDVRLPDGSGVDLMRTARGAAGTPVVLMTAFGTVPDAVEAMRGGASDYLTKPVAWNQLRSIAERLVMEGEKQPAHEGEAFNGGIVGRSPALLGALTRARAAARTDADVLVEAESGTGKELLARFIHDASDRAQKPFVAVNCAAVPEHLLESELFGHARGAFTGATQSKPGKFELAHGGTLLLDEIGEMPLHLQPKLLRALQEREFERLGETRTVKVDIRVIATTNVALAAAVDRGAFRSDLYYRLNVIPLSLPTLSERVEDIPLLAAFFANSWAGHAHQPVPALTPEFVEMLQAREWPGNVRELGNFMRRVLSLYGVDRAGAPIDRACFLREAGPVAVRKQPESAPVREPAPAVPIRQLERLHLEKTLAMTQGNRTHAAEMLGISLRTMRNRIREYGLPPRRYA